MILGPYSEGVEIHTSSAPYSVFVAMFYHHSYSNLYSLVKQHLQPSFVLSVPTTINVDRRRKCHPFTFQDFVSLNLKVRDENENFVL